MTEIIIGNVSGIDKNLSKNILNGKVSPEHKLDLHGLNRYDAHDAVIEHIEQAYQHGLRLILIITGKGAHKLGDDEGVLKRSVSRFLNSHPIANMILFASNAAPRHGGSGAIYVYLRKNK